MKLRKFIEESGRPVVTQISLMLTSHLNFFKLSIRLVMEMIMRSWPVENAKAHFSEFLDTCLSEGPQLLTLGGVEKAVLVPITKWKRLVNSARPSLKELLLSDVGRVELVVPKRGAAEN